MDIIEAIKTIVNLLDKYPNVELLECDVTPTDAHIEIRIQRPPKERKEDTREGSHQISETRPAKLER